MNCASGRYVLIVVLKWERNVNDLLTIVINLEIMFFNVYKDKRAEI